MEAHCGRSAFKRQARNIGRAYRSQAMDLISICRIGLAFSRDALQTAHEDVELRSVLRACDLALHSAADSGQKVNDDVNNLFEKATRMLYRYFGRWHCRFLCQARAILLKGPHVNGEEKWRPKMMITFVLLRSPLAALHDPETVIVRQILSAKPSLSEILWNFGRYKDRARVTLEENPHFYSSLPADESAFTPLFRRHPLGDLSKALKSHDTVYVLVDRPGRMFLETEGEKRSFGNVWTLNDTLILKDRNGVLEGEQSIRTFRIGGNIRYYERPAVFSNSESLSRLDHSSLRPIITTPSNSLTACSPFEDWTVLRRSALCSSGISTYGTQDTSWLSWSSNDLGSFLLPPTYERPGYPVLYTGIETLNDDILLNVFNCYRLDDEGSWNSRLGWRMLSHVCRSWRHLIYESMSRLKMHILCTNGSPLVDTLAHLSALPLVIDYQYATTTIDKRDALGISQALQLRDRVRHVVLHIPSSSLDELLVFMGELFPILEQLSISATTEGTSPMLPETFLAPNLRHLTLSGIRLPRELLLSAVSLVTLTLTGIKATGYFLPKHLVTHLQSSPNLEVLSVGFSVPLPSPSAEWELFNALQPPVTLPSLKRLIFRGVNAFLESLIAQIRTPLLRLLDITLFNQLAFISPHLSHFTNATQGLKLPIGAIVFNRNSVTIVTRRRRGERRRDNESSSFSLQVVCKQFDWQIDSAAQICRSLMPMLSGVEQLALNLYGQIIPSEFGDGAVDGMTWRELLEPFVRARELRICRALTKELSSAFLADDVGSDPGLLPGLLVLAPDIEEEQAANAFSSFVNTCQVAGRPVRLFYSPPRPSSFMPRPPSSPWLPPHARRLSSSANLPSTSSWHAEFEDIFDQRFVPFTASMPTGSWTGWNTYILRPQFVRI
ncbi:hypothetical protein V8E53_008570 [Lactarius tabidus]